MIWYTREASVAIYVANLPFIYPLFRENVRFVRDSVNRSLRGAPRTRDEETSTTEIPSRVRSMRAYHSNEGGTISTRTLTRDSRQQKADLEANAEKSESRSTSKARIATADGDTVEMKSQPGYRGSGEGHWDGRILTKTTIEVDEFISNDFTNSREARQKYLRTPPIGHGFEDDQEKRSTCEVTIHGGAAGPKRLVKAPRSCFARENESGQTLHEFLKESGHY